jgi:hypothetical protein
VLNRYFVPVYSDMLPDPDDNQTTDQRIRAEVASLDLHVEGSGPVPSMGDPKIENSHDPREYLAPGGDPEFSVIVTPQGHPVGVLRNERLFATSDRSGAFIAALQREVTRLGLKPGEPLPAFSGIRPGLDEVVLHLIARYTGAAILRGDEGGIMNNLVTIQNVPGEAWIRYAREEWSAFMPPAGTAPGAQWTIPPAVATKIYRHCFPPSGASAIEKTTVVSQDMVASLLSVQDGVARVRLVGKAHLLHPWWNGREILSPAPPAYVNEEKYADTSVQGYVDVDMVKNTIQSFRLASDEAVYYAENGSIRAPFGVAVSNI